MRRSTRRLLMMGAAMPLVLLLLAWMYKLGMGYLEHRPRSFGASIEWAAETMTTTGYGHDSEWDHPIMQAFVVGVQFTGVILTFLVFPVFLIPFFEERFEGRLPTALPKLKQFVLIYRYGASVSSLMEELDRHKVPFVVFEEDLTVARRLHDRGTKVAYGNLDEDDRVLGQLAHCRGIVANGSDHQNAIVTLTARQKGYDGPIVALVENPVRRGPMRRAGASAVFTPTHALAAAAAAQASVKISPRVSGVQSLGEALQIAEVRIGRGSELASESLAGVDVRKRTGATIIGRWVSDELRADVDADERLEIGTILVAAGSEEAIGKLGAMTTPVARTGAFVVVGYGETGSRVATFLRDAGEEVRVVHTEAGPGVDYVGELLDIDTLRNAGALDAQAVLLTMESDSETVFAAAVVRDLAQDVTIIATVRRPDNVARIHRAGADFAMSIGQVAGQLLAFQLLGEESVGLASQLKLVKTAPGVLAGKPLASSRVREKTGCNIVAVGRGGEVLVELGASFRIEASDAVYVSGTPEMIRRYYDAFEGTQTG